MVWVNLGAVSYQLIGITTSANKANDKYFLYGERANGSAIRLRESTKEDIMELKEAFDYAVKSGFPMFDLVD